MKELHKKLTAIQQELKAPKSQYNKFANFSYRSCEDILESVKPLLKEHDLTLRIDDSIVQVGDRYYVQATAILSDGENAIATKASAREADKKTGMDASQITGAASSYARKYALNGLFAIDDAKDADTKDNRNGESKKPATKPVARKTKPVDSTLNATGTTCAGCGEKVTERVKEYSTKNYGKVLCVPCQAREKASAKN